jgi:hypothetical protein
MMANSHIFTIAPVSQSDIPALAKISGDSFIGDRHTQMKMLGKNPYDHEGGMKQGLKAWLGSERCIVFKAVDKQTGELMGWNCWGFRGFEREEVEQVHLEKRIEKKSAVDVVEDRKVGREEVAKQEILKATLDT